MILLFLGARDERADRAVQRRTYSVTGCRVSIRGGFPIPVFAVLPQLSRGAGR
jgi:hypothetical protein